MLKLEIVTPEKRVVDAEVDSVTVPTMSGEAGILPHHVPLISALKPGILSYESKEGSDKLAVAGGFVEVSADKVSVLTDFAETGTDIDLAASKSEKESVEKEMAEAGGSIDDTAALREKLEFANAKIWLANRL